MRNKKRFNQSKNLFYQLGHPFFQLLLSLIIVISGLLSAARSFKFSFSLPKIKITLPRLIFPSISFPSIKYPKIKRPHLVFPKPSLNSQKLSLYIAIGSIFLFIFFEFFHNLPNPKDLDQFPSKLTTQILDRNGLLLYKIYKDENRTLVPLNSLPSHVTNAFLAAEDKDFYKHKGFSISGFLRALYKNLTDKKTEGGSTITQQLVKNTLLTNEKTLTRKVKELILSLEVEMIYSKDKIFEMYLNQVGFGGPAYGIQEASKQYFNLDAKDLNLSQAAFLAGLPQAPSRYSPYGEQPQLAKERQHFVLDQMLKLNMITTDEYNNAKDTLLVFNSAKIEIKAPHFVMYVKDLLIKQLGEAKVSQGGLIVTTTLDLSLQEKAQQIVSSEVAKLKPYRANNGSALITNPQTGEILAMVGSKDYFNLNEDGQVNLTTALRQPGSSIKPLNYALAFERGYSPGSVIDDKPVSFHLPGQSPWTPKNYDGKFHGPVTLRQALGNSYNIPSVILLSKNGVENFAKLAENMGITTWNDPSRFGLSMALGSLEVRMTELATAYSAFANKGQAVPLKSIIKVENSQQKRVFVSNCTQQDTENGLSLAKAEEIDNCIQKQVISPSTAYLITDILSDNNARSQAFGAHSILNIKKSKVSVKTGTSNELRDNWTIGYNKDYLVATWVGNNNNSPMSQIASGITGASPIWAKIFDSILSKEIQASPEKLPDNLIKIKICSLTGSLPCEGCPTKIELFVKGTEPKHSCDPEQIKKLLQPSPSILPPNSPAIL